MDIKKILDITSLQLILLIVFGLGSIGIISTMYSGVSTYEQLVASAASPLAVASLLLGLLGIIVTAWAGKVYVEAVKGKPVDGGYAGAVISVISGIITGIATAIFVTPVMTNLYAAAGMGQFGAMASGFMVIGVIVGVIFSAIIGFILGWIGGHFAKK